MLAQVVRHFSNSKKSDRNLYLDVFSFIADIWPGFEYPFDEQKKLSVIIIIIIITIIIIIIITIIITTTVNIDSGFIYKYIGSSPYKLKKYK